MLNRSAANLNHFETLFRENPDPWGTYINHAEGVKRRALAALLSPNRFGRILELGCGNGSNSAMLARRGLRLNACDGAVSAVDVTRRSLRGFQNAHVHHLPLPARFPGDRFDAVVIAELLYYLDDRALISVMAEIDRTLRPNGSLLLCHHHNQFHDAAQRQAGLHARFIALSPLGWRKRRVIRNGRWEAVHMRRKGK